MSVAEVRELFFNCDYPFYKHLTVTNGQAICTLYSVSDQYEKEITLNLADKTIALHQISLEIIKLRCHEMRSKEMRLHQPSKNPSDSGSVGSTTN